ncbi:MAG TPA: hypothetical protein VIO94_16090 [Phenylobacterium sp.]
MTEVVSGEAAVQLAHTAYKAGRRDAETAPERLRVQAAPGIAVDITIHGPVSPTILRNVAKLLCANAELLDAALPAHDAGGEP